MAKEKYFIDIGKQGSEGLGKLDYCFNSTTQEFLINSGLKKGMTVLDIGCGSGVMTCWIAHQVGDNGKVIAIENNQNQLDAAIKIAKKNSVNNVEFKLCSVYDIETLNTKFDLIYCRFVLHHLNTPLEAIQKIYNTLNPKGIFASEEGIVNFAFSYPFSAAWGDESLRLPPVWTEVPDGERDGNIGIKMFLKMYSIGFNIIYAKIIHPLLVKPEEKKCLLLGLEESKQFYIEQGHTEIQWQQMCEETVGLVNDDSQIAGFYASCQFAGRKPYAHISSKT